MPMTTQIAMRVTRLVPQRQTQRMAMRNVSTLRARQSHVSFDSECILVAEGIGSETYPQAKNAVGMLNRIARISMPTLEPARELRYAAYMSEQQSEYDSRATLREHTRTAVSA